MVHWLIEHGNRENHTNVRSGIAKLSRDTTYLWTAECEKVSHVEATFSWDSISKAVSTLNKEPWKQTNKQMQKYTHIFVCVHLTISIHINKKVNIYIQIYIYTQKMLYTLSEVS